VLPRSPSVPDLPVDEPLIMPETRWEVIDGEVVYVSPAHEPHATRHSKLQAVLEVYKAAGFSAACDMLTRVSEKSELAPDASIYPTARDAETGRRQLEHIAFEICSTERLSESAIKAARLAERGVRRIFALDVERGRAVEWSRATGNWEILPIDAVVEDPALALPLPMRDVVAAAEVDDSIARALLHKQNPVLMQALDDTRAQGKIEGRAEGKAEAIVAVLERRGVAFSAHERRRILGERDPEILDRWLGAALDCAGVSDVLGGPRGSTQR
jgi:hypothetical protein